LKNRSLDIVRIKKNPNEEIRHGFGFYQKTNSRQIDGLGFNKSVVRKMPKKNRQSQEITQPEIVLLENKSLENGKIALNWKMLKLWNLSMAISILFGMFSMTMIYRYLGQEARADELVVAPSENVGENSNDLQVSEDVEVVGSIDDQQEIYTQLMQDFANREPSELEEEIREMVKGYPIEDMVPYIAQKDRIVAAFLVGIARKESSWGQRVPVLDGQDCYNYWGYRGIRKLMGTGGHTCFNSRKDAVDTVANRLETLIDEYGLNTPSKMIIWKCGSSCAGHSSESVRKWISDVNMYFRELN